MELDFGRGERRDRSVVTLERSRDTVFWRRRQMKVNSPESFHRTLEKQFPGAALITETHELPAEAQDAVYKYLMAELPEQ